jgi:predicted small integral membrane protein
VAKGASQAEALQEEERSSLAAPCRRAGAWLVAAVGSYAAVQAAGRFWPGGLDAYGAFVSHWVVRPLSLATGAVPFTVGEWAAGAYLLGMVVLAGGGVAGVVGRAGTKGAARGSGGRLRAVAGAAARALVAGSAHVVTHLSALFLLFTLLWGFEYARPGVEERLGWPAWEGVPLDELTALAAEAVEATNRAYLELHGADDTGHPTVLDDWHGVEAALDEAWVAAGPAFLGDPRAGAPRGAAKRPLFSPVLRRLGVSGMYFPFTAEAWITAGVPAISISNTLAHEKAHQRGVAGEADAGFMAVMAGASASHPLARYSAAAYVQMQVMGALARAEREAWAELARRRVPGVQRDLEDLAAYWAAHRGPAREIRQAANDAYLRAHGVSAGIGDYGRTVHLLVAWSRLNEGRILPPEADSPDRHPTDPTP